MIYFQLFWNFFVIGCFSFGGGYAMLPLIDRQVTSHGWMTTEQFTDVIAISGMLPGSIGTNAAAFIGYETAGLTGAFLAAFGMVLPSALVILLAISFLKRFQRSQWIVQALYGLRPVIVGLIIYSAIKFASSMGVADTFDLKSIVSFLLIFFLSSFLLFFKKSHPVTIILLAGILGFVLY